MQEEYDEKVAEVFRLMECYENRINLCAQDGNVKAVIKAGRKLFEAQEQLKVLDLKITLLKEKPLNE